MKEKDIKKALEFASSVQYFMNIYEEGGEINFCVPSFNTRHYDRQEEPSYTITYTDDEGYYITRVIPREVALFILTGKKLTGGLSTPMARYYGYRALERERKGK